MVSRGLTHREANDKWIIFPSATPNLARTDESATNSGSVVILRLLENLTFAGQIIADASLSPHFPISI